MKKNILMFGVVLMLVSSTFAQHFNVTRNDYEQVNITFTAADIQVAVEKTQQGCFSKIEMEDYGLSTQVGYPQLPVMSKLLQVPVCDSVIATVTNAQYVEMDAAELGIFNTLYPAQPSYSKSYVGVRQFAINNEVYSKDAFYAEPLVRVEKSGIMRDVCLANIYVSPVAYNPVTKKVRVYRNIEVEVSYVNANIPATYELQTKYGSPMFQSAAEVVANPMPRTREEFNDAPVKYLIVAHSMFQNNADLQDFVNWKKRMGYIVEVAYTSDPNVGTTNTSIRNFVKSKYTNATAENPAPTFLLLIGDHAQIPATNSTEQNSHVTDLYFACWTTGDNIPDCYYGRLSAENVSQLSPQIEKVLMYEQFTMSDPSYLGTAVLIAGTDSYWSPTHADGQINYIYNNYINTTSSTHDYTTVHKHNYNSSSQAATIRSEIGTGCGWANYTAHGGETGWSDPGFSVSQVSSMNNEGKYGVMIGNCCLTGTFNYSSPCFGEALLRTPKKGAMAYIGASEVSYWNEDAYWAVGVRSNITANMTYNANNLGAYDRLFHTHNEAHTNWCTTLGGYVAAGNLAVQSSSTDLKKYYWEIYHIFGDPSIKPYLGVPSALTVSADDVIMIGSSTYQVSTVPYAYVALTLNNELVAAAFADATGIATLSLPSSLTPGEYELAVGAQNYVQYFKTVNVIVPVGPYVVAKGVTIPAGEYPINGTSFHYNLTLENVGVDAATNVSATITSLTNGYTVAQGSANVGNMAVGATANVNNAFTISIPQSAEDKEHADFRVDVSWQGGSCSKDISLTVLAPNLHFSTKEIRPATGTAPNFAPGDMAIIALTLDNTGHADAQNVLMDVTCNYSGVTVTTPSQTVSYLAQNSSTTSNFNIQIGNDVPTVSFVPLYIHLIENGIDKIDTLMLTVGNAMETFETGDFSLFDWNNSSTNPWQITNSAPYAGTYCARSKSNLSNNGTSQLSITMTAAIAGNISFFRKVSSEESYDKFIFYIDGSKKDEISGTEGWGQVSFPVTAGTHTYKFSYEKDYSQSYGSDCAWIDNISFPGVGNVVVEDVVDPIGISDYENLTQLSVYPNPTTGQFTMHNAQSVIRDVNVYDVYGKLVLSENINAETAVINLSAMPSGLYIVKAVDNNNNVITTKIIKR